MVDPKKVSERLLQARAKIEDLTAEKATWAHMLADATLELFEQQEAITADQLLAAIQARATAPIRVSGTEMTIEFTRKTSEVAIKHLSEAVRKREGKQA